MKKQIFTPEQAADFVEDGMTVMVSGFIGFGVAEEILAAIEERFIRTGSPKSLTVVSASGLGDANALAGGRDMRGFNHFAHEGMVKRVIMAHLGMAKKLGRLVLDEKVECLMLPQGVITHLVRARAGGKPGILTHVGLGTFIDPRVEGGRANKCTNSDMVEVMNINGKEFLFYKTFDVDIAIIRGTTGDENGNISMEHEALFADPLSAAIAAKNSRGKVFAQVSRFVEASQIKAQQVKVPACFVDGMVQGRPQHHQQGFYYPDYHPELSGEIRIPLGMLPSMPLDMRKACARRAAMELFSGAVVNLGVGVPDAVGFIASEEGVKDEVFMTIESGTFGGVPIGASGMGSTINPEAIIDQAYQFDNYDGGGLDLAFLGLAQVDKKGNLNVSKFNGRMVGPGGFINISQNAKKVVFCGNFTAGGLAVDVSNGHVTIIKEGKSKKFVNAVEQISFSGEYAVDSGQDVMYITERAVFKLSSEGLLLTEIAPGISLKKDVLDQMEFEPIVDPNLKIMDERIFRDALMGLKLQSR